MIIRALYTGISGIRTNQTAIDVTADNISNVNTIGYRGYSTEFASLYEQSIDTAARSSSSSIGAGVRVQTTNMTQFTGSKILTDRNTDLSINGDGWFGVTNDASTQFTRAGNFKFDVNSDLVTDDGFFVLGTKAGNINDGTLTSVVDDVLLGDVNTQEKLRFPKTLTFPPEPTTTTDFFGNLGLEDTPRSLSSTVVDPQNNKNNLQLVFNKSAVQVAPGIQWDVVATTKSADGVTLYDTQTGLLNFDEDGALLSDTLGTINNNGTDININLGAKYEGITSTNSKISGSSSVNGTIGGDLIGYEINRNAEVIATFTNGAQSSVGKIALYHFPNDAGLSRINGVKFEKSSNSGDAIFYKNAAGENILGATVNNFNLENSNIKLETALTELIILQRSYDANSKTISAANEMMQKALQMDA
ncbi:MAG: flagellar basal body rod protein [Sulfurimonas sp.]|nr:MAG: flagellar basal body rod protein [Sulfurimonas sp.]